MNKYNIKTLITKGTNHDLHCEDDFFVHETDNWIVGAVFDGCSSGTDSHFASTFHKFILKQGVKYIHEKDECTIEKQAKNLMFHIWLGLYSHIYENGVEMLSTVVLILINKHTEQYFIIFAGDGVCVIDDEYHSIHDENGDEVWYLSTLRTAAEFEDYYDKCEKFEGDTLPQSLIISTDGVDTFKDKLGVNRSKEVQETLFKSERFINQEFMLKRLYNILTKNDEPCRNQDDLTMIRFIRTE